MAGLLGPRGAVFFDGDCRLCRRLARMIDGPLARREISTLPLQRDGVTDLFRVAADEVAGQLRMVTPSGTRVSGSDALLAICHELPALRPLTLLARLPGAMPVARAAYRRVARARRCALPSRHGGGR